MCVLGVVCALGIDVQGMDRGNRCMASGSAAWPRATVTPGRVVFWRSAVGVGVGVGVGVAVGVGVGVSCKL